jgi:PhnB protein
MYDAASTEFPGPTPQLVVSGAEAAIAFYSRVFGADELVRNRAADGRIMHCELLMFGGRVLVTDDFAEDTTVGSPAAFGGTTVRLHLYVPNVDEVYTRAIEAGAESVTEPADMFWGDRYAVMRDPYGHVWSLATPLQDLSVAELEQRADSWARRDR